MTGRAQRVPSRHGSDLDRETRAVLLAPLGRAAYRGGMTAVSTLNPTVIDALYEEALDLADRVRTGFDLSAAQAPDTPGDVDLLRVAMSCEALRCTTRMMHSLAWLLNQRAFFKGELSEFQLRRHGRLSSVAAAGEREELERLPSDLQALSYQTEQFHARIARLDQSWRQGFAAQPLVIEQLRQRLEMQIKAS